MDHRFPAIFAIGRKIGLADTGWSRRESATGSGQLGRIGFIGGNWRRLLQVHVPLSERVVFRLHTDKRYGEISRRC